MKNLLPLLLLTLSFEAMARSQCIAHQGSYKNSPRNSLESMQEAIQIGADGIEFDVQHTKDGQAIVMHDPKLTTATHTPDKVCPLDIKIKELTLSEIRDNCSLKFNDAFFPIPTLDEALALMSQSDKYVFIELKDRPSYSTRITIEKYFNGNTQKLRIIAFKVKNLDELIRPEESSDFWSTVKGLDLDVAPWGTPSRYGVNVWNRTYRLRGGQKYRARETSAWTVNREKRLRKFHELGVDFITTDEVEMCLSL
jgi:glycerophosphoryl diester phosphodiesterase